MKESKWYRWLGVIALGVLGSAAWELAVRPIGDVVIKLTLNVVTLGLDSLRDGLYAEAALGSVERASAVTLTIVSSALLALGAARIGYERGKRIKVATRGDLDKLSAVELRLKSQELEGQREKIRKTQLILKLTLCVLIITIYFLAQRAIYINSVVAYFERMYSISAPYISEGDRLKIRSEFFLIKNRGEYIRLVEKLRSAAKSNNIDPPSFVAF